MGVIINLVNRPENMAQKGTGQACGDTPLGIPAWEIWSSGTV